MIDKICKLLRWITQDIYREKVRLFDGLGIEKRTYAPRSNKIKAEYVSFKKHSLVQWKNSSFPKQNEEMGFLLQK